MSTKAFQGIGLDVKSSEAMILCRLWFLTHSCPSVPNSSEGHSQSTTSCHQSWSNKKKGRVISHSSLVPSTGEVSSQCSHGKRRGGEWLNPYPMTFAKNNFTWNCSSVIGIFEVLWKSNGITHRNVKELSNRFADENQPKERNHWNSGITISSIWGMTIIWKKDQIGNIERKTGPFSIC